MAIIAEQLCKPLVTKQNTMSEFIHVGFDNWICIDKISAIQTAGSAPVVRAINSARESGNLVDATSGRKTKSVIILCTGQLVLSALAPDTIIGRANNPLLNNKGK